MKLTDTGYCYQLDFDSATDAMEWLNSFKGNKKICEQIDLNNAYSYGSSKRLYEYSLHEPFLGNSNPDKVLSDMANPSQKIESLIDFSEKIILANDNLVSKKQNRRRMHRRLSDGDEIDIDRFIDREYDTMFEQSRRDGDNDIPFIQLHVGIQANCNWGEDQFFWRMATIYTILSIIEELGLNSEVIATDYAKNCFCKNAQKNNHSDMRMNIVAKRMGEPIDPISLSYVLGSMAFNRVFTLGAIWTASAVCGDGKNPVECGAGQSKIESFEQEGNKYFVNTYRGLTCTEKQARNEIAEFVRFIEGKLQ